MGSSLCNLGCPNLAKMGTHRVQLPAAERMGVEVATRAEALWLEERAVVVRVSERPFGGKGGPPEWEPGEYRIEAPLIVCAAGAVGTSALLLRSEPTRRLQRVGERFTCHPAHILVAEHEHEITNDVGHPKSFYLDRSEEEGYVLETCMYFPATTAKNLTGLGPDHSAMMHAFPRLQMILALGCDKAAHGNRIAIDRDGRAVVHYTCTRATVEALVRATRTAARIFFAAGARRVHAPSADPPLVGRGDVERLDRLIHARHFQRGRTSISAAHPMGGAKMGHPHDSVTDAWGRVHGMPWLRIADASLFPNSVEVNPYVTIMALADRVAEKIRDEAGAMAI
jgi:choline dehydrogenase-like flavoprotein